MSFLYLVPTGMNDPEHPTWGSWAGRYGLNTNFPGCNYYWANQTDVWADTTNRDNSLGRWAVDLQNDFRARLNWCVKPFTQANHAPVAVVNGRGGKEILLVKAVAGATVRLTAEGSTDPDGNALDYEWCIYPEAGNYRGNVKLQNADQPDASLKIPTDAVGKSLHVILRVQDDGTPPLAAYRRVILNCPRGR